MWEGLLLCIWNSLFGESIPPLIISSPPFLWGGRSERDQERRTHTNPSATGWISFSAPPTMTTNRALESPSTPWLHSRLLMGEEESSATGCASQSPESS